MTRISYLGAVIGLILCPLLAVAHPEDHAPSQAASTTHLGQPAGGHGDGHGKAAFIDIHRYDLGIYTLIVFGILFMLLGKFAWGPFQEGLRKREAGLLALREEAAKARSEAEALREKLQKEYTAAQDQIRAMIEEARRDAERLRAEQREQGVKDAALERERAKREIEAAKDAALNEIYRQAVELATMMSEKTLSRHITPDDHRRLLDESLEELKLAASKA